MMVDDPIVDEIRRKRGEHAKAFGYDLEAICADLKAKEQQFEDRLVSLPAKKKASEPSGRAA